MIDERAKFDADPVHMIADAWPALRHEAIALVVTQPDGRAVRNKHADPAPYRNIAVILQ